VDRASWKGTLRGNLSPEGGSHKVKAWTLAGIAAAAFAVWVADGSAHPGTTGVTWTTGASRILQNRCVGCHGPSGNVSPRLDEYEPARLAAQAVKRAVLSRHMPRWYAAPGFGEFRNDPTLTSNEIELLAQWADGRAPRGDVRPASGESAPAIARKHADMVLTVPGKYRIEEGSHTFELATGLDSDRWIRGWEFEPGTPALITGAVVSLSTGGTLGTWTPWAAASLPRGFAYRLPARSTVLLTVYYRRPDGPAADASRVVFYFAEGPKREVERMVLPCGSVRLPTSIDALAIRPAPGTEAGSMTVVARRPDRTLEPLAWFQRYPAGHPQTYWFREAVSLPKGTSIDVKSTSAHCSAELEYVAAGERILYSAPPPAVAPVSPEAGYWCPMHADVRSSTPGSCARCGMRLVPVNARVEGHYWLDAALVPRALRAGEPGTLRLVVREPWTRTVVREFDTVHERPFHLFVVSDDLQEFSHVHPVAQTDGSLELPLTLPRAGAYVLFADFLPVGGTPQMIGKTIIVGGGAGEPRPGRLAPDATDKTDAGLRVRMRLESGELIAGVPSYLSFALEDTATGQPVTDLEPYLGAWGHAFIVSADLADGVHSHPTTALTNPGASTIFFNQRFPRAGMYRLWVQFMRNGRLATVSFTVEVAGPRPTT
jgi:mono/diheme cytochrome c family protein